MSELRLRVLAEADLPGATVTEVCERYGISRQTYYRYKARYERWGAEGLEPVNRRPFTCPRQIDPQLEDRICKLRKDHHRWGARTIRNHLRRQGIDPPAISTIHQALRRNHLVTDQPRKRPKATMRFTRPVPNDLWQMDSLEVSLSTGATPVVMNVLDDHARFLLAQVPAWTPTCEAAWEAFSLAAGRYGLPRQVLTDNHLCFTGRCYGITVEFERNLAEAGPTLINGKPRHPETQGKVERLHRTIREWIHDHGPPKDLQEPQQLLDRFRVHYNEERPHQGLPDDVTPLERYVPSPHDFTKEPDVDEEPSYPAGSILRTVTKNGALTYEKKVIGVGVRWAGYRVRIIPAGELTHVYFGDRLIRSLRIDPSRRYQPHQEAKHIGRRPLS